MEVPKDAIFQRLKHSVQLLASSPEIQLQLLPSFVCKADELARDFDLWQEVTLHNYRGDLNRSQLSALAALDEKLGWLTHDGVKHWTDEAVRTSREWQEVRCLANRVLDAFGWPAETPPSYAHEYVGGKQPRRPERN